MKWVLIIIFSSLAIFGIVKKNSLTKKTVLKKNSSHSFAVLELFTSEGCSSCPPADRLLPQLATLDSNIIPLSFHVDYWNHLGWKDPFSNSIYSDRQREYAKQFKLESIYTPQLIINGEYELVGSNRSAAEMDIKKVFEEKNEVELIIDDVKKENNKLIVILHANGNLKDANLLAALVQKHAEMSVKAGENSGANLSHTNVVRAFIKQDATQKMNFEISLPNNLANKNCELVFFVQQKNNLKIIGVTTYQLPNGQ